MKQYKHKQTGRIAKQFQDTGWYNIILDDGSTHPLMGYFIENTNDWEEIKCKVKPVKLQFGLCKNKMGYYIPQTYFDVNTSILNNPDYHSTHSITIYEEVEDET
jgi:hypothetical protein